MGPMTSSEFEISIYTDRNIDEIEKVMSREFQAFANWLKENELILNCKKGKNRGHGVRYKQSSEESE